MFITKGMLSKLALLFTAVSVSVAQGPFFVAVSTPTSELRLHSTEPGAPLIRSAQITGIAPGENIISIAFRPRNQKLYAYATNNALYTVSVAESNFGQAQFAFTTTCPMVSGVSYSIDFNPVADALRILGSDRSNWRIPFANAATSSSIACVIDKPINYIDGTPGTPDPRGVAYTNSVAFPTSTAEYMIDGSGPRFSRVNVPNDGNSSSVNLIAAATAQVPLDFVFDPVDNTNRGYYLENGDLLSISVSGQVGSVSSGQQFPTTSNGLAAVSSVATVPSYVFAVTDASNNIALYSTNPAVAVVKAFTPITGLPSGATIIGADFRPKVQKLYAIGNNNGIYTISTEASTFGEAQLAFTTSCTFSPSVTYSVDFNPAADALRIIGSDRSNYRIPFATATTTANCIVDGQIKYLGGGQNPAQAPRPSGVAYLNSTASPTGTAEFMIDAANERFAQVTVPNNGDSNAIRTIPNGPLPDSTPLDIVFDALTVTNFGFYLNNGNLFHLRIPTGFSQFVGVGYPSSARSISVVAPAQRVTNTAEFNQALGSGVKFIMLAPGTYVPPPAAAGNGFIINTAGLFIQAEVAGQSQISCGGSDSAFGIDIQAPNVTVNGVAFTSCGTSIHVSSSGSAAFNSVTVLRNVNTVGRGAGIHVLVGATVTITNSNFVNNTGNAAIFNYGTANIIGTNITGTSGTGITTRYDSIVNIESSIISSNFGSGIFASENSLVNASSTQIINNFGAYAGGGIGASNSNIVLIDSVVRGNSARFGGGADLTGNAPYRLVLERSRIVENTASQEGNNVRTTGSYQVIVGPGSEVAAN